jgi:hypothetical protein
MTDPAAPRRDQKYDPPTPPLHREKYDRPIGLISVTLVS